MCKVLMPIKPEYAEQILAGTKTFEYRKTRFKRNNVDAIVIYVTSPVMKVLGEVELLDTLEDSPKIFGEKLHIMEELTSVYLTNILKEKIKL